MSFITDFVSTIAGKSGNAGESYRSRVQTGLESYWQNHKVAVLVGGVVGATAVAAGAVALSILSAPVTLTLGVIGVITICSKVLIASVVGGSLMLIPAIASVFMKCFSKEEQTAQPDAYEAPHLQEVKLLEEAPLEAVSDKSVSAGEVEKRNKAMATARSVMRELPNQTPEFSNAMSDKITAMRDQVNSVNCPDFYGTLQADLTTGFETEITRLTVKTTQMKETFAQKQVDRAQEKTALEQEMATKASEIKKCEGDVAYSKSLLQKAREKNQKGLPNIENKLVTYSIELEKLTNHIKSLEKKIFKSNVRQKILSQEKIDEYTSSIVKKKQKIVKLQELQTKLKARSAAVVAERARVLAEAEKSVEEADKRLVVLQAGQRGLTEKMTDLNKLHATAISNETADLREVEGILHSHTAQRDLLGEKLTAAASQAVVEPAPDDGVGELLMQVLESQAV